MSEPILKNISRSLLRFFGLEEGGFSSENYADAIPIEDLLDDAPFASLLPYRLYDKETQLFINEDSCGFVIEALLLLGADDAVQRELTSIYQEVLAEGDSIQCMLFADHRVGHMLDIWKEGRQGQGEVYESLAKRRAEFFLNQIEQGHGTPPRIFRFFLSYSSPLASTQGKKGKNQKVSRSLPPEKAIALKEKKERILKTLSGMTYAYAWDGNDLIQHIDGIVNFHFDSSVDKRSYSPLDPLSTQIPSKGGCIDVSADKIAWRREKTALFKSYVVRDFPDMWSNHQMQKLIGDLYRNPFRIDTPFYIHYGVYCPPQGREEREFGTKMHFVEHQGRSLTLRRMIPELEGELHDYQFVRNQLHAGERFVWTELACGLWAQDDQELTHARSDRGMKKADQALKSLFRMNGFKLLEARYTHLPHFLSHLPMNFATSIEALRAFGFTKTSLALEAGNFVPVQGEWLGTTRPGMLLQGRRGHLAFWDPFDNRGGNFNTVVVGRSGSGKSVFMQELLMSSLGQGARVFVIDVGRSFEKMCSTLDGQFIEFSKSSDLCLNPFTHVPADDPEGRDTSFSMIKSILGTMAAPQKGTSDLENAILEKAIRTVWAKKGKGTTVTDIADFLLAEEDKTASNLGKMLIGYTREGSYARFFEGENNVNFNKDVVVIELEELKEQKDLQSVVMQMMIMSITNHTFLGDRKRPFHICIDEAWDLLRAPQAGLFIETLARRLRKYNGSLVIGTQSVDDFYQAPGALAAFENSDWMCFLAQKRTSITRLKESGRIDIGEEQEHALASLTTVNGEYSDVMICDSNGFYALCQLKLDPFSGLLYSTKADEYARLRELQAEGHSVSSAIEQMLQETNQVADRRKRRSTPKNLTKEKEPIEELKREVGKAASEQESPPQESSPEEAASC